MMTGPLPAHRSERAALGRGVLAAPRGNQPSSAPSTDDVQGQQQIAAQRQAFDFDAAERAEIEREHEALQAMLLAWFKNEDEIMKKWIALI
jgi:hypothetical protein